MRKLLLITTALVALSVEPAQADPLTTLSALMANGVGFWSATYAAFAGTAWAQLAASYVLSVAAQKLAGKPKREAQRAELARPTSLPAYRFVYGR